MSTAVPTPVTAATAPANPSIRGALSGTARQWLAPITAMTFVLGAFIGLALKTQNVVRHDDLPSARYSGMAEAYLSLKQTAMAEQSTIGHLQQTNRELTDTVSTRGPQMRVLDDQVKQAQMLAGLTPLKGPGIVVVLQDSKNQPQGNIPDSVVEAFLIHDRDIQWVINELKAGGGEAFAVNNQRVIGSTSIRCVGPAIQVNGVPLTPPYRITAIGDPDTLNTTLNLKRGVAEQFRSADPAMISITKSESVVVPAYDGATGFRYAKPATGSGRPGI